MIFNNLRGQLGNAWRWFSMIITTTMMFCSTIGVLVIVVIGMYQTIIDRGVDSGFIIACGLVLGVACGLVLGAIMYIFHLFIAPYIFQIVVLFFVFVINLDRATLGVISAYQFMLISFWSALYAALCGVAIYGFYAMKSKHNKLWWDFW